MLQSCAALERSCKTLPSFEPRRLMPPTQPYYVLKDHIGMGQRCSGHHQNSWQMELDPKNYENKRGFDEKHMYG